jgi:iduronate 2-sulfatase
MQCGGVGDPGTDPDYQNKHTRACPGAPNASDTDFLDAKFRDHAVSLLQQTVNHSRPFAFFVGFRRPHMPWRMPWRFYDQYNGSAISISRSQSIGENITTLSYAQNGFTSGKNSWNNIKFGPHTPLPRSLQQHIRRAYYSAVSWMDDCVGRVLGALRASGKANNTAVLLFGDRESGLHCCASLMPSVQSETCCHTDGWKLGEHGTYSKTCVWETDTRVPLVCYLHLLTCVLT